MMASAIANGNRDGPSLILKGVDPETCMIVFKNHWAQVVKILEKHDPLRSGGGNLGSSSGNTGSLRFGPIPGDEASAVQNYVEHMLFLLIEEECGQAGAMGPILEFVVMENVMEKLFLWSLRREFTDDMKLEQLRMYEMLVGRARQPLLHHKPILRPLMMLLSSCSGSSSPAVDAELVLLLNQLCSILVKDPSVLELFFHTSEDQGAANFLIFSLLIPFIHREGMVGQQARDALLYIMALSAENHRVAKHIAENTFFCPVLATGLSGLYSSLPTRLEVSSEEWHFLQRDDWQQVPPLVQFLNSLEFCNAVIQVAHPTIREQLVGYIYKGFLVPVLAPALHKLTLEEVMTTTAYLDLFLRSVSEPALLQTFLSFVLLHQHENVHILDTLVSRINTPFQLGTVSLALFRTLIGLYCEDVMLQLILRYLIPCNHMMLSQRSVVKERDCYSISAAKFLALMPSCCTTGLIHSPIILSKWSDGSSMGPSIKDCAQSESTSDNGEPPHDGDSLGDSCMNMDDSYLEYLLDARARISSCVKACRVWSAPYDGDSPAADQYQHSLLEEAGKLSGPTKLRLRPLSDTGSAGERTNQLELEWDDSYDVVLSPEDTEEESTPPVTVEPPKHIQEMRKSAIMLIKESYIEESDFQDDVMVYNLIAQKDTHDVVDGSLAASHGKKLPLNGLNSIQHNTVHQTRNNIRPGHEEDLASQYEELIRTLEAKNPHKVDKESLGPVHRADEDDVDFSSFTPNTPEREKIPSPLGLKARSGSRSHLVPFTGPFISVLMSRLENMLENSFHVNLLLTGILAQLASYPQPLLSSFLLNTSMVFQPSVRSLYQVLATVKNHIEHLVSTRKNFPQLLDEAQQYLLARENAVRGGELLEDSASAGSGHSPQGTETKRPQVTLRRSSSHQPLHLRHPPEVMNEALAVLLFAEFLKELAAIAQEHSLLSLVPAEE